MTDIAVPAEAPAVDAVICTSGLLLIELVFVFKGVFFPMLVAVALSGKHNSCRAGGDLV